MNNPSQPATVLVVEDDTIVRRVICAIIKSGGYKVIEADGAASALQICKNPSERIDLILTDFEMPSMNGSDLIRRLKLEHGHIRAVLISGFTPDIMKMHGGESENMFFMRKPFLPEALLKMIESALS